MRPARPSRPFFLGTYYTGALVGFAVVLVYCASGGFLAVAWSDVFQGALMFLGLVLLPIVGFVHAGGVDAVLDGLRQIDVQSENVKLLSWSGDGLVVPQFGAQRDRSVFDRSWLLGSPQIFVRFLALRDEREIPKGRRSPSCGRSWPTAALSSQGWSAATY